MFEFIRKFRKWVMIGTVILVSFAFGITGVVLQVFSPSRNPADKEAGSYSVSALSDTDSKVSVKQREFRSFQNRWNSFLINNMSGAQRLIGPALQRGGGLNRMLRMAERLIMRQNPFYRFISYTRMQYGVDFIRNLVFLRSGGDGPQSDVIRMTPELDSGTLENLDDSQKGRRYWDNWIREVIWRLMYVRDLAREQGFSSTDQEVADLVRPYLNQISQRAQTQVGYSDLVNQADMGVEQFETTLKELITILKFLGSISRSTAVGPENLLDGFQEDQGYGALLVTNIDHERVKRDIYDTRSWRVRQRYMALRPTEDEVTSLSAFSSDLGSNQNQSPRSQSGGSDENTFEKRQFSYLYLPVEAYREKVDEPSEDRIRSYYENNKGEFEREDSTSGTNDTSERAENGEEKDQANSEENYRPFDAVRDQIRKKLYRRQALREADKDFRKLINSTISRREIREKTVDFQELVERENIDGRLQYRTSPLLDKQDMRDYLREKKGVTDNQLDRLHEFIFSKSPAEEGASDPYMKESIWFKDGAILPQLTRVESNSMSPSFEAVGNGAGATNWALSEFSDRYPVYSLQLKQVLRWRKLDRNADQRASQLQQSLTGQYRRKRDEMWKTNDVFGPPVPPRYLRNMEEKGTGETDASDVNQWPPATFSNDAFEDQIALRRQKWKRARAAFEKTAQRAGLEVHVTEPFKLDEGPAEVEVQRNVLNQLQGNRRSPRRPGSGQAAELFEPLTGSSGDQSQIAVLFKKLPKSGADLEAFLNNQRQAKVQSARSSFLKQNVITLIEEANLTLADERSSNPEGEGPENPEGQ